MTPKQNQPYIQTARLILTTAAAEDAPRLLDYALRNKEHLEGFEPARPESYYTLEFWAGNVASFAEDYARGKYLRLLLLNKEDKAGPIVGMCSLSNIVRGPFQAAHLGYSLDCESVGKGLMQEALAAAINYGFEQMNLHRIMANYMPGNERSGRLLRRLGFVVEGYARDYLMLAGEWQDHILTSLTNEKWKSA